MVLSGSWPGWSQNLARCASTRLRAAALGARMEEIKAANLLQACHTFFTRGVGTDMLLCAPTARAPPSQAWAMESDLLSSDLFIFVPL